MNNTSSKTKSVKQCKPNVIFDDIHMEDTIINRLFIKVKIKVSMNIQKVSKYNHINKYYSNV